MGKIIELNEALANQIAAGEVVERPASVVKELVENAIDAGSHKIVVRIVDSGLSLIEVTDDGSGIEKEDVTVALRRHATSKIKSSEDLFRIRTLGFRGEALPSIASVSELTIETSVAKEESGTKLIAKGGKITSLEPLAKRLGTKISVANLFYNTPARLKYIKSLQAELSHITDIINRLSLAHPEISFTLINEGRTFLQTAGNGDLRQVIAAIYGISSAKKMREIKAFDLDFEVSGYVSLPELTRANRNYITLLINGRFIKNFALNRAILEAYGNRIMVGRFPLAVISIKIDPHLADVNVHPTKQEVRLSKEAELMALIRKAVNSTLSEGVLIPEALENLQGRKQEKVKEAVQTELPLQNFPLYYDKVRQDFFVNEEVPTGKMSPPSQPSAPKILTDSVDGRENADVIQIIRENTDANENHRKNADGKSDMVCASNFFGQLEYLAQLHATYLLCQAPDGLYLVDQHAAQERVNYEYWKDKIGEVSMEQQILLAPYLFTLPKNDFLILAEKKALLHEAGVFLEEYGENQFILREHPIWLKENEIESSINEMIDIILSSKEFSLKQYRHDLAAMVACKSAIKANHPLDAESARALLKELATCENPYSCAHGRPTIVHFSGEDIQKMFRRIQETHRSKAATWKNFD
ncbi:DNA mismatch repair endonuclease MutL [Lactococcus kimchii]|uniref:DNA mismatch repair endonuclease MutL n=1 Tax=Lactococcus sp. S-13 TaxID=2507158 RepID=UPI001022EA58|nr:DNA mismatch repair endonuclease MutL [Lactococcus sp. S-13]RZI49349.1 DNA mismatch repair endonuclease MutL [Lactococcus sp. S-13]